MQEGSQTNLYQITRAFIELNSDVLEYEQGQNVFSYLSQIFITSSSTSNPPCKTVILIRDPNSFHILAELFDIMSTEFHPESIFYTRAVIYSKDVKTIKPEFVEAEKEFYQKLTNGLFNESSPNIDKTFGMFKDITETVVGAISKYDREMKDIIAPEEWYDHHPSQVTVVSYPRITVSYHRNDTVHDFLRTIFPGMQ